MSWSETGGYPISDIVLTNILRRLDVAPLRSLRIRYHKALARRLGCCGQGRRERIEILQEARRILADAPVEVWQQIQQKLGLPDPPYVLYYQSGGQLRQRKIEW